MSIGWCHNPGLVGHASNCVRCAANLRDRDAAYARLVRPSSAPAAHLAQVVEPTDLPIADAPRRAGRPRTGYILSAAAALLPFAAAPGPQSLCEHPLDSPCGHTTTKHQKCHYIIQYSIVFSPEARQDLGPARISVWVGQEGEGQPRVAAALADAAFGPDNLNQFMEVFHRLAYPGDVALTRPLLIDPPKAPASTAFRETNTQVEKDLDSSVMWRAGRALFSAVESFREQRVRYHTSWIADIGRYVHGGKETLLPDTLTFAWSQLRMVDLFHPILVVEAPLWISAQKKVSRINWCRLEQRDVTGHADWWFDVVSMDNAKDYLAGITRYYDSALHRARAKPGNYMEMPLTPPPKWTLKKLLS